MEKGLIENQLSPANEYINMQRLEQAFATFQPGEPYALTQARRDFAKGFKDESEAGNDLGILGMMNSMERPQELFGLYEDGFHTPARKPPEHSSFILNDPMRQAIAQEFFGRKREDMQTIPKSHPSVSREYFDRVGGRVNGLLDYKPQDYNE